VQAALERAISRLRMQYTLGFNPSNPGEKGAFHKLAVRFASENRCPDCRLLARSGYYAGVSAPPPPPDEPRVTQAHSPQDGDQLLIRKSITTAGTIDLDLPGIPFAVTTTEQIDSGGQPQVKVDLQISVSGIAFKTVDGRRCCKLQVAVFYANSKRKILGSDWKIIEGRLSDEAYNRIAQTGIPFSTVVPLKAEKQMLKVVVYDEESDNVGSKLIRLR
jgi:hypothetical protein